MSTRRMALSLLGGLGCAPWLSSAATHPARSLPPALLVAAWERPGGFEVGVLAPQAHASLRMRQSIEVPTRAHGLLAMPDETVLAVARRPGDWLLRWPVKGGKPAQWQWAEPGRAFNGHVIASPDGKRLYTTETDLDTGAGLVGVRDARSLAKLDEWPTFGLDPHALICDGTDLSRSTLIVANGGIPTRPETGRAKPDLARMDSSLVRLDATTGALLGQWRLADRRLSLRHLAWQAAGSGALRPPVLGIALQAEHDAAGQKHQAPVLALFDGSSLKLAEAAANLAGYGADICALADGWAVSCPRVDGIALFAANGRWRQLVPLANGCALATNDEDDRACWAAGQNHALLLASDPHAARSQHRLSSSAIRLDNHWVCLPPPRRAS